MREKERASLAVFSNSGSSCSLLVCSNGITGSKQCSLGSASHWASLEMTDTGSRGHLNSWYSSQSHVSTFRGSESLLPVWLTKGCSAAHNH